jgi:hypothetical protein
MESGGTADRSKPFRIETVRGEPYTLGERKLTPLVRIASWGKARATIGTKRVTGWGGGFARITPLAILEETDEGEKPIAIRDSTAAALRGMVLAALASTLFFAMIRWLARR